MISARTQVRTRFTAGCRFDDRFARPLLDRIISGPDRVISDMGRVLKHDRTTTVVRVDDNGAAWVVKRYNTKNPWHALRRTLRRSRAFNCWTMSRHFRDAGIVVPTPVACIEKKFGPFRGRSYFLYEFVDAGDLLSYRDIHRDEDDFEPVFRQIVNLFGAMHRSKINHGDMKATNILVNPDRSITLLDLDAAAKPRCTGAFTRGYARDRARFLKNWHHDPGLRDLFDKALPE